MEKPQIINKDLDVKAVIRRIYGKEDTTKHIRKSVGSLFG